MKSEKGFTLQEMPIVMVIIGVLMSLLVPAVQPARDRFQAILDILQGLLG